MAVISKSEVDLAYKVTFVSDLWAKKQIPYFENK